MQYSEQLGPQVGIDKDYARNITARAIKAFDEPVLTGSLTNYEDDRFWGIQTLPACAAESVATIATTCRRTRSAANAGT